MTKGKDISMSEQMKAAWADPEQRAKMSRRPALEARNEVIETQGAVDCTKCGKVKPLSDFPMTRKTRRGQPRYAYCKECHSEYQRVLRIKKWFNLTTEDYDKISVHQGGCCAICKQPPKPGRRLAVDHDHKSGLVRGLLCSFCNRAIALFRDNLQKFENSIAFLKSPPATEALGAPRYGLKGRVSNKAATTKRLNRDMFERPKNAPIAAEETEEPTHAGVEQPSLSCVSKDVLKEEP